jgi:hypothetical protein
MRSSTMRRLLLIGLIGALSSLACATTQSGESEEGMQRQSTASSSNAKGRIIRAEDSVCRAYQVPADFDTNGCTISGPYPGEMKGAAAGSEMDFPAALAHCVKTPSCTGISTSWYIGSPFLPLVSKNEFQSQDDSYGCTLVVNSCNR